MVKLWILSPILSMMISLAMLLFIFVDCENHTVHIDSLPHRKWRETKQEPGTAGLGNMLGCCLISLHFLWGKLSTRTVQSIKIIML